jgi:hypothetical protein
VNRLSILTDALVFARRYTATLLDTIPADEWFRMPGGSPTHVAWQVGHLAMAENRLVYERVCGGTGLLAPEFIQQFSRESVADPDPANHPSPSDLRATLDRVHSVTLDVLATIPDAALDEPAPGIKHRYCTLKWEFIRWAGHHEMLHTGQIGLLRRMLGQAPVW